MPAENDWREGYTVEYREWFSDNLAEEMKKRYHEGAVVYGETFHGDPLEEAKTELIDGLYYLGAAMEEALHNRALLMAIKYILARSSRKDIAELNMIRETMDNNHQPPNDLDPKKPEPRTHGPFDAASAAVEEEPQYHHSFSPAGMGPSGATCIQCGYTFTTPFPDTTCEPRLWTDSFRQSMAAATRR